MAINPLGGPIDYSSMLGQHGGVLGGQGNSGLGNRFMLLAEQKREQLEQEQFAADLNAAMQAPTVDAFSRLGAKYHSKQPAISAAWEMMGAARQDEEFTTGSKIFQAIGRGRPDVAKSILQEKLEAAKAGGQPTEKIKTMLDGLDRDPKEVMGRIGAVLATADPKRWKTIQEINQAAELQPLKVDKAKQELEKERVLTGRERSLADKAAVEAKYAESAAATDLAKKNWDITKLQNDISVSRQNMAIATLNSKLAKEANELKKNEIQQKIDAAKEKREQAIRDRAAEASASIAASDNLNNTVEKILNMAVTGRDKAGKPTGFTGTITSATGPISLRMPTLSQDVADFEEAINTLGSQITMSRIGEMKGALSDKDLATLQSSLQSLSLRQSPQQLVNNLLEVQRLTQKARKNTMDKFGAPATLSVPDTPAAQPSPAEIDDLVKKYGGGR